MSDDEPFVSKTSCVVVFCLEKELIIRTNPMTDKIPKSETAIMLRLFRRLSCFGIRKSDHPSYPAYLARIESVVNDGAASYFTYPNTLFNVEALMLSPVKALSWLPERREPESSVFSLPSRTNLRKHLQKWAEQAGLERDLHFHLSRHTYGTMLITAGVDLYTASKMMGHADVRPTQVYAKIVDKKKEEAVSLIDKVF